MINIFISYSHKDVEFKNELSNHLTPLSKSRKYQVDIFSDTAIQPSEPWDQTIKNKLTEADIIVLLVSSDFLASYYIYEVELKLAIEKHKKKEITVIPVILRHCDWKDEDHYIHGITAYPTDAKPITDYQNRDRAYLEVVLKIKIAVENIFREREQVELKDFVQKLHNLKQNYAGKYERMVNALNVTPQLTSTLLDLFEQSYQNTFSGLQELIDKFVPNDIIINFAQMKLFYDRMNADIFESFVALTHYKDWEYWTSPASEYWLEGNKELLKRGRIVERTFVVESKSQLASNERFFNIIKHQIELGITIKILVEDKTVRDFFDSYNYLDKSSKKAKFRLGYVIYDTKYISFWIDDIDEDDSEKYEKRKLIIKVDKETLDVYLEKSKQFDKKSETFTRVAELTQWLK